MNNAVQTATSAQPGEAALTQEGKLRQPPQERYVVPPVDVFENDHAITLLADLPGVTREQLQLRVDGDNLLLEATAAAAGPQNMELVYGEAQCPAYRRQFTLSRELDTSRIDAQLREGVLRLTIPKAEEAKPRRIDVRAG
ncbi:Hsp20/alpha crystallin family protein [Ramlibacter sp.]|uniref:Hsp20/alpha crystallin family protein n=1 Tax=Ramlibacter sp. TaxID=1917967 RepID=UPI002620F635|nr:Hsp20/alpha crystallin family protein [Ramlibacter sp.]MDB5956808.1 heat-shock protein Hsp20 [Ramlibacter sp.]